MIADDLTALLNSRRWVKRRVDRVEFLDLMTVRRTITLTLDLAQLSSARAQCHPTSTGRNLVPLGWFVPWANAGAVLVDADQRVIPYLTSRESDREVRAQMERRLDALRLWSFKQRLGAVVDHRSDPGRPGDSCSHCQHIVSSPGHRELMTDKWGCCAVLDLLCGLHEAGPDRQEIRELVRILLAWQRNFVLFARLDASTMQAGWVTLRLSYDEQLLDWEPPWEHRRRVVLEPERSQCEQVACRSSISRGGPFAQDLDELAPKGLRERLARSQRPSVRKLGRRGFLPVAWHVAWHQASGIDVPDHHVDVVLPNELAAVRMRMLRLASGKRSATVADQVGSRATIVAPESCDDSAREHDDGAWSPTLLSLVITQRSPTPWYGGAWIASLTGVALLLVAVLWLPAVVEHVDAGVAALLLAPTLVATALSVRAASEIAEQLTTILRRLIGAVAVLTATCTLALIAHPGPPQPDWLQRLGGRTPPIDHLGLLRGVLIGAAFALLAIAAALCCGARNIKRLLEYGVRRRSRHVANSAPGRVLNPAGGPPVPPPDCFLDADEGDLVPWGWLNGACSLDGREGSDSSFWSCHHATRRQLVDWVRRIVQYKEPLPEVARCPQCRC